MTSAFACDEMLPGAQHVWYRAITIPATPALTFPWLCQLRLAPYSYDWLDNFGRQSPRMLLPGLPPLAVGQRVMHVFSIASFAAERHLTVELNQPWWLRICAAMVITYRLDATPAGCRLVVKMITRFPANPLGLVGRLLLPTADWIMMKRQLCQLRDLASRG